MATKFCLAAHGAWRQSYGSPVYGLVKILSGSHKVENLRKPEENCLECCKSSLRVSGTGTKVRNWGRLGETRWMFAGVFNGFMPGRRYCTMSSEEPEIPPDAFQRAVVQQKARSKFRWETRKAKPRQAAVKLAPEYKPVGDERLYTLYEEHPEIEEIGIDELRTILSEAALYGFSPTKTVKIIAKYPDFVTDYYKLLPMSAKVWRRIGINEDDRVTLFHKYPELMSLSSSLVTKAFGFLSLYFSNAQLTELIRNCPTVMVDHEIVLKEKIELLWMSYSHSTEAIAKCDALKKSAFFIRVRHEFLARAGLFKPVPHHKFLKMIAEKDRRNVPLQRDKYFTPNFIICSSDEKFLAVCTSNSFTLAEFQTFETFYEEECSRKSYEEIIKENEDWGEENEDEAEENAVERSIESDVNYSHEKYYYVNSSSVGFYSAKDSVDFYY